MTEKGESRLDILCVLTSFWHTCAKLSEQQALKETGRNGHSQGLHRRRATGCTPSTAGTRDPRPSLEAVNVAHLLLPVHSAAVSPRHISVSSVSPWGMTNSWAWLETQFCGCKNVTSCRCSRDNSSPQLEVPSQQATQATFYSPRVNWVTRLQPALLVPTLSGLSERHSSQLRSTCKRMFLRKPKSKLYGFESLLLKPSTMLLLPQATLLNALKWTRTDN